MLKTNYIIHLILSAISLYILLQILIYLNEAESCPCFIDETNQTKYAPDISFMKFYQFLEIFSLLIFLILITFYKFPLNKNGKKANGFLKILLFISIFVLLFISGNMSYNVGKFYLNIKEDCHCVNKWQKYFIYLEGIFNSIYFLRLLYVFLFILILGFFNFMN